MTETVVPLRLVEVGEGYRFEPDDLLEAAKAQGFSKMVIIADLEDAPGIWISGTANAGESMMLIEAAKLSLIKGMVEE